MFAKTGISSSKVGDDPSTQVSTVATSSYELSNSTREAKVSWQDEAPAIINNDSGPQVVLIKFKVKQIHVEILRALMVILYIYLDLIREQ